jgi:agmatinase
MLLFDAAVISLLAVVLADQIPFWIEDETLSTSHNLLNSFISSEDEFDTAYAGITTFAHFPFINCLHPTYKDEAKEKFDIAIVGAPFDTTVTYRPG